VSVHKNQTFPRRLRFAFAGLAAAWRAERSFRLQLIALAVVFLALLVLRVEPLWWAVVIVTSAAVIGAELLNTALEHLADHLHPQVHPQIRIVKDCAAAAVLVVAGGAVGVAIALVLHLVQRL
jgi:undecaprenol kinase